MFCRVCHVESSFRRPERCSARAVGVSRSMIARRNHQRAHSESFPTTGVVGEESVGGLAGATKFALERGQDIDWSLGVSSSVEEFQTTIDYVDKIRVPGQPFEKPANEYWRLLCLWQGMSFLAERVGRCQDAANEAMAQGLRETLPPEVSASMQGLPSQFVRSPPPGLGGAALAMVTTAFEWYAVSAFNYACMIGAIRIRQMSSAPIPRKYAETVIPELVIYRDKVAAHAAWTSKHERDNDAERLCSVIPKLSLANGRLMAGGYTITLGSTSGGHKSGCLPEWSLTDEHARLAERYWPS